MEEKSAILTLSEKGYYVRLLLYPSYVQSAGACDPVEDFVQAS